jgi:hypothetical protein
MSTGLNPTLGSWNVNKLHYITENDSVKVCKIFVMGGSWMSGKEIEVGIGK